MYCYVLENITDIYTGLALEQFFFNTYINSSFSQHTNNNSTNLLGECIVIFWQSHNAVVIGRNQNPLYECNLSYMKEHNVSLARRDSGGGTVYHDTQNVNVCIISVAHEQQVEKNLLCFKILLALLGIEAEITKRHDLVIDNKKISGSAMRYSKQVLMHHFTLLLSPNIQHISNVLNAKNTQVISSPGTASLLSNITGTYLQYTQITETFIHHTQQLASILSTHNEFGMNIPSPTHISYIKDIHYFIEQYVKYTQSSNTPFSLHKEIQRLTSTEWIYKRTPPFTITIHFKEEEIYPFFSSHSNFTTCFIICKHGCIELIQDAKHNILYASTDQHNTVPILITYNSLLQESKNSKHAIIKLVTKKLITLFF